MEASSLLIIFIRCSDIVTSEWGLLLIASFWLELSYYVLDLIFYFKIKVEYFVK